MLDPQALDRVQLSHYHRCPCSGRGHILLRVLLRYHLNIPKLPRVLEPKRRRTMHRHNGQTRTDLFMYRNDLTCSAFGAVPSRRAEVFRRAEVL